MFISLSSFFSLSFFSHPVNLVTLGKTAAISCREKTILLGTLILNLLFFNNAGWQVVSSKIEVELSERKHSQQKVVAHYDVEQK